MNLCYRRQVPQTAQSTFSNHFLVVPHIVHHKATLKLHQHQTPGLSMIMWRVAHQTLSLARSNVHVTRRDKAWQVRVRIKSFSQIWSMRPKMWEKSHSSKELTLGFKSAYLITKFLLLSLFNSSNPITEIQNPKESNGHFIERDILALENKTTLFQLLRFRFTQEMNSLKF
jgi:hypothetical protein